MASPEPIPGSHRASALTFRSTTALRKASAIVLKAIFRAGGSGLVLSTAYAAMGPENLSAVGATLRELKLV